MKDKQVWTELGWDWKSAPTLEQLQEALEPFGVWVYEDPMAEGTDGYGFIFSNMEIDEDGFEEIRKEIYEE